MSRHRIRRFLPLLLALAAVGPARADQLPPLPLPDCVANGLTLDNFTDCEGNVASYADLPDVPRPATGAVGIAISTRAVDFRLDADRGGQSQLITFSFDLPGEMTAPGPNGSTYISAVKIPDWPPEIFPGVRMGCRQASETIYGGGCDGEPMGDGDNPLRVNLVRQGTCEPGVATSCTYRVTWGPYDRRVREPILYRIKLGWTVVYNKRLANGMFENFCAYNVNLGGCILGGASSYFTYATVSPPPVNAIGSLRRLGAKVFEFDGRASNPDVVSYEWILGVPDLSTGAERFIRSPNAVFTIDFAKEPNIPGNFFAGLLGIRPASLRVTDRWNRPDFVSVPYSFAEPVGTEGPLEITSLVLVGVDNTGLATLKAVVKNKSGGTLTDVFLDGKEGSQLISPDTTPSGVTLAADESVEFTVTLKFDAREQLTVEVKAFGTSSSGPVKSAPKSKAFTRDGATVGSTTVTQASQPGDRTLFVASNDGFAVGDYVLIDGSTENVEARRIAALGSLIFDVPLAKPHAVGAIVTPFANTAQNGDVIAPTISVTAPAEGAVVCQNTPLAAAFTCTDPPPASGVEECGDAVADGESLDTGTPGSRQTTIRTWDFVGNLAQKTVTWTVSTCSGGPTTTTTTLPAGCTPASCDDGNACTDDACGGAGCTNLLSPGVAGLRCLVDRVRTGRLCGDDAIDAKLRRQLDGALRRADGQLAKVDTATGKKRVKAIKQAVNALRSGSRRVAAALKKGKPGTTPDCGGTLIRSLSEIGAGVQALAG
jgi:hypothetical protein